MNLPLFPRDLAVAVLASGSAGNCTYIGDGRAGVLVDCGVSAKQVLGRLDAVGLGAAPIDAVLLTHEHGDHVGGARVLAARLAARNGGRPVPFYASRGTIDGLPAACGPGGLEVVRAGERVRLRSLELRAFAVPHDTPEPLGWSVASGGTSAVVLTDQGHVTPAAVDALRASAIAVVEFNHDPEMLDTGSYDWRLKRRVGGAYGHLSNTQAAALLAEGLGPALRALRLAHLSRENNTPAKALAAAAAVLAAAGRLDSVELRACAQATPAEVARVRCVDW
jgi:phosphoribosyl 1,2-cyclic phosphodiesterase